MRLVNILGIFLVLSLLSSHAQWEKVKNIPPTFINSYWLEMYFLPENPNYGWVCGYDGKVLRTTDMGKTWSGTIIRGAYQLEHIHFVDEKVGFTSGIGSNGFGKIYKTTDGGATWFDITPVKADDLWGHWFVDKDYGIVVGGGCVTPQRFFVTTNGGISWDFVTEVNNFPNSGLTDVILYSRNGLGYATSSGFIWQTTNGGRSWQIFSRSGGSDWQEDLWIFGNTIIVPYSVGCGGEGGTGGVRSTNNLGRTWKQFSTGTSMFGAFLHDSLRGWVCGWDRAVYYTSDGGNTWNLLNCGIDPGVSLDDFWFINDTLGWVVGNGIYKYTGIKKVVSQIQSIPDTTACEGDTIILKATNDAKFYQWSTNSTSKEIKVTKSGRYELLSWDSDCDTIVPAVVTLTFHPKPKIKLSIEGTGFLCEGSEIPLWYVTDSKNARWADGRTDTILVNKPGKYIAYASNEFGCIDSAYVEFRLIPRPKIQRIGNTSICEGDSVVLFLEGNFANVFWLRDSDSEIVGIGKS
ncbi:MAG: WD40/YVTN/BNR-like repeat-containing protein, partial [Candidatus Kapaibacteriota bacterium]